MSLKYKSLEDLLPESISSTPAVSINSDDTLADAALLLPHHLETFTDSLVVTKNDLPVGIVGGIEILEQAIKNQTKGHLYKTRISDAMSQNITIIDTKDRFSELVSKWSKTRRAFAITPNKYHGYSAISARKILEIGVMYGTNVTASFIPRKKIATFNRNDTVKDIISKMFENHTRKLVFEGTDLFVNDRIIIEKLVREFDCMKSGTEFLQMSSTNLPLEHFKTILDDATISEICKKMQEMKSPYLINSDRTISPWDMVLILGSIDTIT